MHGPLHAVLPRARASTSSAPTTSSSGSASTSCRRLLVDDADGICAGLDAAVQAAVDAYVDPWQEAAAPVHPLQFTTVAKTLEPEPAGMSAAAARHSPRPDRRRSRSARRACSASDGRDVAVFRCRSGEVYATEAECPHRGGPLADGLVGSHSVICPLHGFVFDLRTGEAAGPRLRAPGHPSRAGPAARRADAGAGVSALTAATFGGARVALLESRLAAETAAMVRRLGGEPVSAPSLAEVDVDADAGRRRVHRPSVGDAPDRWSCSSPAPRSTRLFAAADRLGRAAALLDGLAPARRSSRAGRSRPARSPGAACRAVADRRRTVHHDRRDRRARVAAGRGSRRDRRALRRAQRADRGAPRGARRARPRADVLRVAAARGHRAAVAGDRRA